MNIIELQSDPIPFDKAELEKCKFLPIAVFDELGNYYTLVEKDAIYKTQKDVFVESVRSFFQSCPNARFPRSLKSMAKERHKKMLVLLKSIPHFAENRYLMEIETLQKSFLFKQYNEINFLLKKRITNISESHFEYMAAPLLAKKKAYGNANTNDALFSQYGVKIKKQDGGIFSQAELKEAAEIISSVFNFLKIPKALAKSSKLKISFTHNKSMKSAVRAAGVFIQNYEGIGIPFPSENHDTTQSKIILAHELGHWIDYSLSQITSSFASAKTGSIQNLLAGTFLQNMNNFNQSSDYWRNCTECFARAIEEYFAIENCACKSYFAKAYYCNEINYNQKIKPLVKLIISRLECM